jgi:SAM-dependent methyltransferase
MPVDLTKLDDATRARHLGNPDGEIGLAIANALNSMNARVHQEAYRALAPSNGNAIFEVGFGNGHLVPELLSLADALTYAGIDISETMVSEARRFNADLVAQGRVIAQLAASSRIPFPDATFDRALALNTIYFWDNPFQDLSEIRRMLRAGGWLVLGAIDPAGTKANPVFKHGFRLYAREQIADLLRAAGFSKSSTTVFTENRAAPDGSRFTTDYFIVTAYAA